MSRKIHVHAVSVVSLVVTVVLGLGCVGLFSYGLTQFNNVQAASDTYIECSEAADKLSHASQLLTDDARLAAMTGDVSYVDAYFEEADTAQTREAALETLREHFDGTDAYAALVHALNRSNDLMGTEVYAMRLVCEAAGTDESTWPAEVQATTLSGADAALNAEGKLARAVELVSNDGYDKVKAEISNSIQSCSDELVAETQSAQGRAATIFTDVYRKLGVGVALFGCLMLMMAEVVRFLIIRPLIKYSESIEKNTTFPVIGAAELQVLAETYNRVYEENEATQMLIRHQAEHDALTDLLNRGSYDRMLALYESGDRPFALILIDVDTFKQVNDGFGHGAGDAVLKRVASLLTTTFRNIDHVCRIGGDEFAVIMVEMTPDLAYTIREKVEAMNEELLAGADGLPSVSLSVGVAFSERENPGESLYKDADEALYYVKEHGRCGIRIFGE